MVMRTSILTTLFFTAVLLASSKSEDNRLKEIESKMNYVLNKAGIQFNGTFRSQYLNSMIDDKSGENALDWAQKKTESNEYTSVDFDISARPNDALSGHLVFRMHQNWQNFFSDVSNPIFSRWISIDGNVKQMFRFNVGDYRQHYSPLTLWSPDIEIAYEPDIFAAKRLEAQKEVFLGNNDRILQGINFNFDAEVVPIFNEMHLNVTGARLRLNGTGWGNGSAAADKFEDADMDRYAAGGNLDLLFLRGVGLGGTILTIFDLLPTYNGTKPAAQVLPTNRRGLIGSFRLNPSTRIFLDTDAFSIGLNMEVAGSKNLDSAWYDTLAGDSTLKEINIQGMAIDAGLKAMIKLGGIGTLDLSAGFMNNDPDYINELAQSPTFLGQRIMNIENDYARGGSLYTTFDALYDYVFKFAPSSNNQWTKEPHRKISYVNAILTRKEIEDSVGTRAMSWASLIKLDPTLQTVLPYGPATPNRTGPKVDLKLKLFDNGVDVGVSGAFLKEMDPDTTFSAVKTSFTKLGGGFSIDIATWAKALNCFKLSVGYSAENFKNDQVIFEKGPDQDTMMAFESNNSFINLGFYYNFWKRFSLLAGHQQIVNKATVGGFAKTIKQGHCAVGLEYKVNNGAVVTGRVGRLGAKFSSTDAQDSTIALNNFNIWRTELFLTVDF